MRRPCLRLVHVDQRQFDVRNATPDMDSMLWQPYRLLYFINRLRRALPYATKENPFRVSLKLLTHTFNVVYIATLTIHDGSFYEKP